MKSLVFRVALAAGLALAHSAQAQSPTDHSSHGPAAGPVAATDLAEGEVVKIDKAAGKVTLKHGPIRSLDMPPMTMVYLVKDGVWLAGAKVGDKVRFGAVLDKGQYVVTTVRPAK